MPAEKISPTEGTLPIEDLKPDPENRRTHPDRNIEMVSGSLQQVGAARSIVIDEGDVILAGNGVTQAAIAAGITNVRVIEADGTELIAVRRRGLTAEQKRSLSMFDNRTAELATWDFNQLSADKQAGLDLRPFWTEAEEAMLLGQAVKPSWGGMPEFEMQDENAFRSILVHFASQADVDAFAALIGQTFTDKTKFIWHPAVERDSATRTGVMMTSEDPDDDES
jgi:ParB/Sulfiredoxin domain